MAVVLWKPEGIAGAFQGFRQKLASRALPPSAPKPALTPEAENGSV
jgi:hypothetical protein